jgi:two-component system, OmpR family, sensor histidine kinase BaeS
MRLRTKYVLSTGGLMAAAVSGGLLIGYGWGAAPQGGVPVVVYLAAAVLLLLLLCTIVWIIAEIATGRIKLVLHATNRMLRLAKYLPIHIRGRDEFAELANLINELAGEWIRGLEARNQLVSDAAHELRTPVAILRGHLETMLKGATELKRENLVSLLDETKRMARLIQELQQLSLAESGRLNLERSWVDLSSMLGEVADIFMVEAEEKGISLNCGEPLDCEVYCDYSRIKQVLINLIGNAIQYTPERGTIDIRQSLREDGSIRIEIADTGSGIPSEKLPYIFHRFYRVDDSRSRSAGGTGLGLAIAKQFIVAHGGQLEVFSAEGKGTLFMMTLPAFPDV